ncbi:MAG: hypothetical protein GTO17_03330 [Candidatus Aminicenantes bacterium]|nr:hypothetical protein [Candidatus Aminicenantes bacterium]
MKGKIFNNINKRKEERGAVLVIGVLFLTFMLLLAIPFLFQVSNERRSAEKSYKAFAALSMAEAGVERAIWELNSGDIYSWSGTSSLRSMNIGSFLTSDGETMGSIDIRVIDPEGDTPVVESTGQVPYIGSLTVNRTARVELWRGDGSHYLFGYGIFGDEGININSKAQTDSYNSTIADYDPQNPGTNGDIGTNATHLGCIFLANNARVYGNATTGYESMPEDIIITQPGSVHSGDKLAMTKPQPLPSVAPPEESLSFMGEYFLGPGLQDVISESGEFTSFRLENSSKVTITADVTLYVTGDFSMNSFSQIEIAEGASVTVYLGGTFTQHSNTQVNNLTMDPTKLLFLGTDSFNGSLDWNATTTFYGSVYTPRAAVNYNSDADFYGAISGKYVDINSAAELHYDEALGKHKVYTGTTLDTYIVKSWHELVPAVGS